MFLALGIYILGMLAWCAFMLAGDEDGAGSAWGSIPSIVGCLLAPLWPLTFPLEFLFWLMAEK